MQIFSKTKIKEVLFKYYLFNKILYAISNNKKRIKGQKNIISFNNSLIKNCFFKIKGNNNRIIINSECIIKNTNFYIRGNDNVIEIGKQCRYRGGEFWIEDNCNLIRIGEKSTFELVNLQVTEDNKSILIGDNCMFAYDIELKTGDSHSIIEIETNKRINPAKNIFIGNQVWIGAHVVILKGVEVGDNSIIGTNSVCTKSIAGNSLAVGIPARIIKENVKWQRERI